MLSYLAERAGCIVAYPEYRLAPENPFPAAVDDCAEGILWLAEHADEFGFDPAKGNVTLRGGKYTFKDLPPSVGDRLFVNANLFVTNCVCLKGELEANAGGSILYPNVLNNGEKDAIKALVANSHDQKQAWDDLVETLSQ